MDTSEQCHDFPLTGFSLLRQRLKNWWFRKRRKMPRLVWPGQEIDVTITFFEDPIDQSDPLRGLFSGGLYEIEKQFRHMGIKFDKGQGFGGRDWEWDWSLSGPVSVTFRDHAKKPERRTIKKVPDLRVVA